MKLVAAQSQVLVVDVQARLAPAMAEMDACLSRIALVLAAAERLAVPISVTQQYPAGLGETLAQARPAGAQVFDKMTFSALSDRVIAAHLAAAARPQLVLVGIEAHVCVLQTALDAIGAGLQPVIVADAVASRRAEAKALALARARHAGVWVVDAEMTVFEWLGAAGTADFKALATLVK